MIKIRVEGPSADEFQRQVVAAAVEEIAKVVGDCTCPDHGQQPEVVVLGTNLANLQFEVFGCCDKIKQVVSDRLAAAGS